MIDHEGIGPPEEGFGEAWTARAFGLVAALIAAGRISPAEWSARLGALRNLPDADAAPDRYWQDWLAALEALAEGNDFARPGEIGSRAEEAAARPQHVHVAPPGPIFVDPPRGPR